MRQVVLVAGVVLAVYAVVVMLAWAFQRQLIYLPWGQAGAPAAAGLADAEKVSVPTRDGLELAAWLVPAEGRRLATVLVLPGNAGNRALRAPLAARLSEAGLEVLLVDYRGFGGNPGQATEPGLRADARAARAFLLEQAEVEPDELVVFGESLGAAVAVDLAAEHGSAAVVLRSPFTDLAAVGRQAYPFLPVRALLKDRYRAIERIGAVDAPVLVLVGSDDGIVPPEQSRRLYEAAAHPKRLRVFEGLGHNDVELLAGDAVIAEIVDFLADETGYGHRP